MIRSMCQTLEEFFEQKLLGMPAENEDKNEITNLGGQVQNKNVSNPKKRSKDSSRQPTKVGLYYNNINLLEKKIFSK